MMDNDPVRAMLFASAKHANHFDDDGKPYIHHLIQVVDILKVITKDKDILCAAWLHDTLEDTKTTHEELIQEFGQKIADLVHEMTHEGSKDDKGYFFPRLQSLDAILIKFADRLSNLSRMSSWNEQRKAQYMKRSKFWNSK